MELVKGRKGGYHAQSQLHGNEGKLGRLQPDPGLANVGPIRRQKGQDSSGAALGHASPDGQGHEQAVAGGDDQHRHLQ